MVTLLRLLYQEWSWGEGVARAMIRESCPSPSSISVPGGLAGPAAPWWKNHLYWDSAGRGGSTVPLPLAFLEKGNQRDLVLGTREVASRSPGWPLGKRPLSQSLILGAWVGSVSVQGTPAPPGLCPRWSWLMLATSPLPRTHFDHVPPGSMAG